MIMKKIFLFSLFAVITATNFYCTKYDPTSEQISTTIVKEDVSERGGEQCTGTISITLKSVDHPDDCVSLIYNRVICDKPLPILSLPSLEWTNSEIGQTRYITVNNDEKILLKNQVFDCTSFTTDGISANFDITMPNGTTQNITINNLGEHTTPKFYAKQLLCPYYVCDKPLAD